MLDSVDLTLYIVLGIITILLSSLVAYAFIFSKELRQHPSGLLASISICEVIMAYHSIIFAIGSSDYIRSLKLHHILIFLDLSASNSVSLLCGFNQVILSASIIACICYNISICLDLVITLYNPLIPGSIRKKWYHVLTFVSVIYFTVYVNTVNEFVSDCQSNQHNRLEIMNTASVDLLLLLYLAIALISVFYSAYRFANGLKLESEATKHYLIRHILYVIVFVLCWVWPAISYLLGEYGENQSKAKNTVDLFAIATTSSSGFLLGLIRISDPVVWRKVKQLTFESNSKNVSEDAWTQPISVVVQGNLNKELTVCIFQSIHLAFLRMKELEDVDDFESQDYYRKSTHKLEQGLSEMWGIRDKKLNGVIVDVFAPDVFKDLIQLNSLEVDDILTSIAPENNQNNAVNQSAGKSGSFFLFTNDRRLSIKTVKHSERRLMLNFLKDYHEHIKKFPNSLLCRIYGVFSLKIPGVTAMDILLMQNIFYGIRTDRVYDIKGSTNGRTSKKNGQYYGPLKDLDFIEMKEQLLLSQDDIENLELNMLSDVKLLKKNKLMDYSMLIASSECPDNSYWKPRHSFFSIDKHKIYTLGIIDFLTEYGYWKSIERSFTALRYGRKVKMASVANPARYSNRFFNFIFSVVVPIIRRSSSFIIKDD